MQVEERGGEGRDGRAGQSDHTGLVEGLRVIGEGEGMYWSTPACKGVAVKPASAFLCNIEAFLATAKSLLSALLVFHRLMWKMAPLYRVYG